MASRLGLAGHKQPDIFKEWVMAVLDKFPLAKALLSGKRIKVKFQPVKWNVKVKKKRKRGG